MLKTVTQRPLWLAPSASSLFFFCTFICCSCGIKLNYVWWWRRHHCSPRLTSSIREQQVTQITAPPPTHTLSFICVCVSPDYVATAVTSRCLQDNKQLFPKHIWLQTNDQPENASSDPPPLPSPPSLFLNVFTSCQWAHRAPRVFTRMLSIGRGETSLAARQAAWDMLHPTLSSANPTSSPHHTHMHTHTHAREGPLAPFAMHPGRASSAL